MIYHKIIIVQSYGVKITSERPQGIEEDLRGLGINPGKDKLSGEKMKDKINNFI